MSRPTWVFGYGSLVAPASMARTLERPVRRDEGFRAACLHGYGRRWNYGSLRQRGDWQGPQGAVRSGIVVSLGLEVADERSNDVAVRVDDDELALLDWRESDYERTDVTDRIEIEDGRLDSRVVTYVPRSSAIRRYVDARHERRAAVRRSCVELVRFSFQALGEHHLDEYVTGTPDPDVPVVDFA